VALGNPRTIDGASGIPEGARWPRIALVLAVFVAALLSRVVWWSRAPFHPDESTILWMALEAVRAGALPDHGLVSSYQAFQPPGLVWVTMPLVALGGGRPEIVILGFGVLNAASLAFFVATAARAWGLSVMVTTAAFAVVGPDAFMSAWIWHPSLYTAATALLLAAGIRVRSGSAWWALVVVAVPGLYALIHYSGLVLFGPGAVLLWMSRRRLADMWPPLASGLALTLAAWTPFLLFEAERNWADFATIVHNTVGDQSASQQLAMRYAGLRLALRQLVAYGGFLPPLMMALALAALVAGLARRATAGAVACCAAFVAAGLAVQVAADLAQRLDVLMLWLLPLYVLAGWAVGRLRRAALIAIAVVVIVLLGAVDLGRAINETPASRTLAEQWATARSGAAVAYAPSKVNSLYLPCDPPWDWGAQTWYLREVLSRGEGVRAAEAAGAFAGRRGRCGSRSLPTRHGPRGQEAVWIVTR